MWAYSVVLPWGSGTVDSPHINSESFPSQHGTLTRCWFNVGQRRRRWSNIKTFGKTSFMNTPDNVQYDSGLKT